MPVKPTEYLARRMYLSDTHNNFWYTQLLRGCHGQLELLDSLVMIAFDPVLSGNRAHHIDVGPIGLHRYMRDGRETAKIRPSLPRRQLANYIFTLTMKHHYPLSMTTSINSSYMSDSAFRV